VRGPLFSSGARSAAGPKGKARMIMSEKQGERGTTERPANPTPHAMQISPSEAGSVPLIPRGRHVRSRGGDLFQAGEGALGRRDAREGAEPPPDSFPHPAAAAAESPPRRWEGRRDPRSFAAAAVATVAVSRGAPPAAAVTGVVGDPFGGRGSAASIDRDGGSLRGGALGGSGPRRRCVGPRVSVPNTLVSFGGGEWGVRGWVAGMGQREGGGKKGAEVRNRRFFVLFCAFLCFFSVEVIYTGQDPFVAKLLRLGAV